MKDGRYALAFTCDGYSGAGGLVMDHGTGAGCDGSFVIRMQVVDRRPKLTSLVSVSSTPHDPESARARRSYCLTMTGSERGDGFSLLGVDLSGRSVRVDCRALDVAIERDQPKRVARSRSSTAAASRR